MTHSPIRTTLSALLLALIATLAMPGCEDEAARRQSEIQAQLNTLTGKFRQWAGAATHPGTEAFTQVQSELTQIASEIDSLNPEPGGQAAAKMLLASVVNREMARLDLAAAQRVEAEHRRSRRVLHDAKSAASLLNAIADSLGQIDTNGTRSELEAQRASARELLNQYSQQMAELDGPITELAGENQTLQSDVDRLSEEANQLRQQAAAQSRYAGLPTFEQAVALERQADQKIWEISMREIKLDCDLRPEHELAQARAGKTQELLSVIDASESSIDQFVSSAANTADATRETATELGDQIDRGLAAIAQGSSDLDSTYERALSSLAKARQNADRAARELPGSEGAAARVEAARALEFEARALWARGRGYDDHARLLEELANTNTNGEAERYRADMVAAVNRRDEALAKAAEAYAAAQEKLGSASGNEVNQLRASIDQAIANLSGGPNGATTAAGPGTDPARTTGGGTSPAGAARVSGNGLASHEALKVKLGNIENTRADMEQLFDLFYTADPTWSSMFDSVRGMAVAAADLNEASMAAFGEPLPGAGPGMDGFDVEFENPQLVDETADTAVYEIQTDEGPEQVTFRAVDGRWYVDFDAMMMAEAGAGGGDMPPEAKEFMVGMIEGIAQALTAVAPDIVQRINSGEFTSAQEAAAALQEAMSQGAPNPFGNLELPDGGGG